MSGNQISTAMMELIKGELVDTLTFEHQSDAVLSQVTPAQNTWYTVLDTTKHCKLYYIIIMIEDDDESLEVRLTIDGVTYEGGVAATYSDYYCVFKTAHVASLTFLNLGVDLFKTD